VSAPLRPWGLAAAAAVCLVTLFPSVVQARWPFTPSKDGPVVVVELDRQSGEVRAREADGLDVSTLRRLDPHRITAAFRIDKKTGQIDPLDAGLPWYWLVFGFGAQLVFTARMLAQWIASERAKASVVPLSFWLLSAAGGLMLLTYFLRRGDPVGVAGQLFGLTVYARNLIFIRRQRLATAQAVPER
jgi:lipid-A-disaccharide synthase-like uncharacterized protein